MKALLRLTALVLLLPATVRADPAGCIPALLFINESDSDAEAPYDGTPFTGERDLYLWFWNYVPDRVTLGLDGTLQVVDVEPAPGWVNTGTLLSPRLERTGCEGDWHSTLLARVRVSAPTEAGGRLCFVESTLDSVLCFDACMGGYYELEAFGYVADGGPGCPGVHSPECLPLAVDETSWGVIKARYR